MKKIIYSFLVTFFLLITNLAYSNETSNNETFTKLIETTRPDSNIANISDDNGLTALSKLLVWFKSELMTVVGIFVIGVFIFIGFKFVMARGNPEEFKKAWFYLIYAVLGVFFIFMAWGLVSLVSTLSL